MSKTETRTLFEEQLAICRRIVGPEKLLGFPERTVESIPPGTAFMCSWPTDDELFADALVGKTYACLEDWIVSHPKRFVKIKNLL